MDLNELLVFARVAQAGSFTRAAAVLGMPKSTVSRKVSELERRLKARLLQRTTRKLSLTEVGRIYLGHCERILAEFEDAERAVSRQQEAPRGLLRVTAPLNFGFLAQIIADYLKRFPEVQLEMSATSSVVDLVEERFDVGIRAGPLADSSLVARSLGSVRWFLAASPAYLKQRGRPARPEDLKAHACLCFGSSPSTLTLRLEKGGRTAQVSVSARMLVSEPEVLRTAALAGLGIAVLPAFQCFEELRSRRLERVLREWSLPPTPVHVVYPTARYLSPRVRSFVEHLQQQMTPPPWELGPIP